MQATGYGLLISVLQRERGDFDGFLRFWRRFLTPKGLMYWQLVRGGDGEVRLRMHTTSSPPMHCPTVLLRPGADLTLCRAQIKANLGTLNSATDGDMDIAFALLLAAKVRPPCVLETFNAAKELSWCMCCPSTLQLPTVMGGQALQCF